MSDLAPTGVGSTKFQNRILNATAVVFLMLAGLAVVQTAAAGMATAACAGSLGYREASSTGELVVYYSSASGGTNCAQMNHLGSTYGVSSWTGVSITLCTETSSGSSCTYGGQRDVDDGNFAYYAGPVKVTITNGKCIAAEGIHGFYYNTYGATMCG